ncbi:MAG TPA: Gfo/Idh/MocA family oxidoreductase, partial [Pseudonocardiaceae bacterium]|nr:Gfo/Idh/MocA family oxidoreductase [Pseudonocardiaceae bacterium]
MATRARPVRVAVLGAGIRGTEFARHIRRSGGIVVALAEPDQTRRDRLGAEHAVPPESRYDDWRRLAERGPGHADAVVITTQDAEHAGPCERFAELGYHILCEKPMAPTEPDAARMAAAVERAGVLFAVCHTLRYRRYTRVLTELLASGRIGRVMSVQHLEPVGWWHFAHSYVRGNWRREGLSSSLLMAKCCHDLDWLGYVIGSRPRRVASFGRLSHFRAEQRPAGAADRCQDCAAEPGCPYSATRLYRQCLGDPPLEHWPLGVLTPVATERALALALAEGPYGRCVYGCDNDVVDHQVVALDYDNGVTATHTVTAFTEMTERKTRIFGTHGRIDGDGYQLSVYDFRVGLRAASETITTYPERVGPHGDGDQALVNAFLSAVATGDP